MKEMKKMEKEGNSSIGKHKFFLDDVEVIDRKWWAIAALVAISLKNKMSGYGWVVENGVTVFSRPK